MRPDPQPDTPYPDAPDADAPYADADAADRPDDLDPAELRFRVRRPDDLLAMLPYQIGFHPTRSVVAVLVSDRRVGLTVRLDLLPPDQLHHLGAQLASLAVSQQADGVALVVYDDDAEAAEDALAGLVALLLTEGVDVAEAVVVCGGRWWTAPCLDERCGGADGCGCVEEGDTAGLASHPLAVQAVLAGRVTAASREQLAAQVAGPGPERQYELDRQVARARRRFGRPTVARAAARLHERVARHLADDSLPDAAAAVELALLTTDVAVRDVAWAMIRRADARRHVALWSAVVAAVPDGVTPGPLGLVGAAAWVGGDGALMNCCVERLLRLRPRYGMAQVLADLSDAAAPPQLWDTMAPQIRATVAEVTGLEVDL